jgi:ThiF family
VSEHPINRSSDLRRLRDEGYNVSIRDGHLLVGDVPYVAGPGTVKRGVLVSTLTLAGDETAQPETHVAMFIGDYPCDAEGRPLEKMRSSGGRVLAPGLEVDHWFSSKPLGGGYADYYDKMTAHIAIFEGFARVLQPDATARTHLVVEEEDEESVFRYLDTASSRAGIAALSARLAIDRVGIVGLGGTGSYVLDFVAKTQVKEIHLFDADVFYSHNAFRAPGAAAIEDLRARKSKVGYLAEQYDRMRRGIVRHEYGVDAGNASELAEMDFVFVCVDDPDAKREIVERLEQLGKSFIDVGMGVDLDGEALGGILRVSTSTPANRQSLRSRVSLEGAEGKDDYDLNIQIAELNALNAALAVIKWKKLYGIYQDPESTLNNLYTIETDQLLSEDEHE